MAKKDTNQDINKVVGGVVDNLKGLGSGLLNLTKIGVEEAKKVVAAKKDASGKKETKAEKDDKK
jgi:hypothetical protein